MPRELFGEVTDPSISIGSRKWYTVPLSLTVHTVIVALLVITPLLAAATLPMPDLQTVFVVVPPSLPSPPPVARRAAPPRPVVSPDAAPVRAPDSIAPESELPAPFENAISIDAGVVGAGPIEGTAVVVPPPPVITPPPAAPVRVGGQIRPPERVSSVDPEYPPVARSARLQGLVIIEATIDTEGGVHSARVLRSDSPLLNDAALNAVRQWRYTPTLLNGVPVSVVMTVTIQFRLH